MAKKKFTDEVVEVYRGAVCPAPGCMQPGPHRHVVRIDKDNGSIDGYGEATAIEGMELQPIEPEPEPDTDVTEDVTEVEQPESEH